MKNNEINYKEKIFKYCVTLFHDEDEDDAASNARRNLLPQTCKIILERRVNI